MTSLDLRPYVVAPTGAWINDAANFQPTLLRLVGLEDGLTLVGPLRVRICVLAQNRLTHVSATTTTLQTRDAYSYTLDIPPGQSWSYPSPRDTIAREADPGAATAGPTDAATLRLARLDRALLGANAGAVILIRPAGSEECGDPCDGPSTERSTSSCGCRCGCASCGQGGGCGCRGGCSCSASCGCGGCASSSDLPCDFAVRGQNLSAFFPSPCEPCTPGAPVSMPATKGPALLVRPAAGGTVRTRFYTGMQIAKEDFETDQKNARLKRALLNRALGQGVAWGLSVALDGDGVCVMPGYGLDCCGNDIVLPSAYRVDAASLVADPAAASIVARRGPQRLALVLEYFECPQDARPVHGDPCTLDGARCEPSRIRETVRLRLAPPCEVDDSGPIKEFLAEMEKLRRDPAVGPYFAAPAGATGCDGAASDTGSTSALPLPPTITLEVVRRVGATPSDGADVAAPTLPLAVPALGRPDAQGDTFLTSLDEPLTALVRYSVRITVKAPAGYTFAATGAPTPIDPTTGQPSAALALYAGLTNATQVAWEVPWGTDRPLSIAPDADPIPAQYIHRFAGWQLRDNAGGSYSGSIEIRWTKLVAEVWAATPWGKRVRSGGVPGEVVPREAAPLVVHVDVPPSAIATGAGARVFPCLGAPCDPRDVRFWSTFPWLHANPQNPKQAADPRVIVLAIAYAVLAGEMHRTGYGTSAYAKSAMLEAASAVYAAMWKLYFGTMPDTERYTLTDILQRLLQAWCKGLLYPGPTCRCCPHGVVVGCAVVEGGTIVHVDPWGGRRWVVQYPLLSYWGQQFGLMPADAIASRLFGMICCFASLAAPKFESSTGNDIRTRALHTAPGIRPTEPTVGRGSTIQLGPGTLVIDEASAVAGRAETLGATRRETLSPIDFVVKVSAMMGAEGAPAGAPLVDYAVVGFPAVHFVAPEAAAAHPAAPPPVAAPAAATSAASFGRLVADEVASHVGKGGAPRLLRPVAESLAFSLAASLPLSPPAELRGPLAAAGIDTVGKVLDRDPEQLLASVLQGHDADRLSAVLDDAEAQARSVATVVVETIAAASADKQITARSDLRAAATASGFARLLADRLKAAKIDVPAAAVANAVSEAALG